MYLKNDKILYMLYTKLIYPSIVAKERSKGLEKVVFQLQERNDFTFIQ